jgi:exopolyphosphatase/guanosine-5'-triphosphate,3'-diphosphate pyrophosphatase
MRLAAVDIGTNTVRLLVADVGDGTLSEVTRDRVITRLGQGVDAGRRLDPDAVERTLAAAHRFVMRARELGAEHVRVAGTSALRDAADRDRFARKLEELAGAELELVSGADEGRLSLLGATANLASGNYVVCDIGGGSTEISTSRSSMSLDVGSVRLKERFLRGDPPSVEEVAATRAFITDVLDDAEFTPVDGDWTLIGVAGTITTLAALVLGLSAYDRTRVHHATIHRSDVRAWSDRLLEMTADEIACIGPVERGRADVIGAGVLILRCVLERWEHDQVLVSEHDILEGLVLDLARRG